MLTDITGITITLGVLLRGLAKLACMSLGIVLIYTEGKLTEQQYHHVVDVKKTRRYTWLCAIFGGIMLGLAVWVF